MIWLLVAILFICAVCALASTIYYRKALDLLERNHTRELAAFKKVGSWYEKRCAELEQESALLAAQVVAAGAVPIHQVMPFPDKDPGYEYAYDSTGLVRERLDPADVSTSSSL